MTRRVIVDSGPLVAFLDRREAHHAWIAEQARTLPLPWLSCKARVGCAEERSASFAIDAPPSSAHPTRAQDAMLEMVESRLLKVEFALPGEIGQVRLLREKYHDIPMSLADACLVRMAEKRA